MGTMSPFWFFILGCYVLAGILRLMWSFHSGYHRDVWERMIVGPQLGFVLFVAFELFFWPLEIALGIWQVFHERKTRGPKPADMFVGRATAALPPEVAQGVKEAIQKHEQQRVERVARAIHDTHLRRLGPEELERHWGMVRPTDEGHMYYEMARAAIKAHSDFPLTSGYVVGPSIEDHESTER